jgi:hypothetical protein
MIETVDLQVEARDQDIVVTMPGTSLRVVYRKPHRGSQLVARLDYFQDQQKGPVKRAEFIMNIRTRSAVPRFEEQERDVRRDFWTTLKRLIRLEDAHAF